MTTLPEGWLAETPDVGDIRALTTLLRRHEEHGRGSARASEQRVLVEIHDRGGQTRDNRVLRDQDGVLRGWASAHDRVAGRMLLALVVDRRLEDAIADKVAHALLSWAGELVDGDQPEPAGALVGSVIEGDGGAPDGGYVEYIGVLQDARGRGVATSLLKTVIADAAANGRDRVGLEVDADSPTGADGLYASMGWAVDHVTESWHRDVQIG